MQGGLSLIVRATGRDPHETTRLLSDPWHAVIHVVWGVILLAILAAAATRWWWSGRRSPSASSTSRSWCSASSVHHPFGLMIDGPENVFHAVVGGLALILGLRDAARRRERAR